MSAKLSSRTEITSAASGDLLHLVDISDTTDGASGSSRKITRDNLLGSVLTGLESVTATATELNVLDGIPGTLTATELGYVDGVTSAIQTQLNAKAALDNPTFTTKIATPRIDITEGTTSANAINFGSDVNLYRNVSNELRTDDKINAALGAVFGGNLNFYETGTANGAVVFGDGAGGYDTNLYRSAANTLKTDDNFIASGTIQGTGDLNLTGATDNITVNSSDPYRTITITPGFLKPTTTSGCAASTTVEAGTNDIDYDVLDFDTTTAERAFANLQMADSWDAGAIQFRYIWTASGGGAAETVEFELSGRSYANDDAIDQAVGTAVGVSDTWIADGDIHVSSWSGDVTLAGTPAAGEWVHVEIKRDVDNDNLGVDARLIGVQIRYKVAQFSD